MGGGSGKTRENGRSNDAGDGRAEGIESKRFKDGTLGRDQQKKQSNVLLKDGKVQPGTMAYRNKK